MPSLYDLARIVTLWCPHLSDAEDGLRGPLDESDSGGHAGSPLVSPYPLSWLVEGKQGG